MISTGILPRDCDASVCNNGRIPSGSVAFSALDIGIGCTDPTSLFACIMVTKHVVGFTAVSMSRTSTTPSLFTFTIVSSHWPVVHRYSHTFKTHGCSMAEVIMWGIEFNGKTPLSLSLRTLFERWNSTFDCPVSWLGSTRSESYVWAIQHLQLSQAVYVLIQLLVLVPSHNNESCLGYPN